MIALDRCMFPQLKLGDEPIGIISEACFLLLSGMIVDVQSNSTHLLLTMQS